MLQMFYFCFCILFFASINQPGVVEENEAEPREHCIVFEASSFSKLSFLDLLAVK